MIDLVVNDFCDDCSEFEPCVTREHVFGAKAKCITHIHCEYESRCLNMYMHIRRKFKEETDE